MSLADAGPCWQLACSRSGAPLSVQAGLAGDSRPKSFGTRPTIPAAGRAGTSALVQHSAASALGTPKTGSPVDRDHIEHGADEQPPAPAIAGSVFDNVIGPGDDGVSGERSHHRRYRRQGTDGRRRREHGGFESSRDGCDQRARRPPPVGLSPTRSRRPHRPKTPPKCHGPRSRIRKRPLLPMSPPYRQEPQFRHDERRRNPALRGILVMADGRAGSGRVGCGHRRQFGHDLLPIRAKWLAGRRQHGVAAGHSAEHGHRDQRPRDLFVRVHRDSVIRDLSSTLPPHWNLTTGNAITPAAGRLTGDAATTSAPPQQGPDRLVDFGRTGGAGGKWSYAYNSGRG